MQIHIVSDVICPWCYIGKRQIERAWGLRPDYAFEVRFLPFQLNPGMPGEGMERDSYLDQKFGAAGRKAMDDRLSAAGAALGIPFDFAAIKRVPNTVAAHCLIRWAGEAGVQLEVVEALFAANFVNGEDVGDTEILCRIAERAGMDVPLVRERLNQSIDRDAVVAEDEMMRGMGIDAVPCTIVDRKFAIMGGQAPEAFAEVFDRAAEAETAPER